MDMLTSVAPTGVIFLRRIDSIGRGNSPTISFKRSQEDTSLTIPLVSETTSIKQENHSTSTPHLKSLVSSCLRFSMDELPLPQTTMCIFKISN